MPQFSKKANLLKDLEAIAKSHDVKAYLLIPAFKKSHNSNLAKRGNTSTQSWQKSG